MSTSKGKLGLINVCQGCPVQLICLNTKKGEKTCSILHCHLCGQQQIRITEFLSKTTTSYASALTTTKFIQNIEGPNHVSSDCPCMQMITCEVCATSFRTIFNVGERSPVSVCHETADKYLGYLLPKSKEEDKDND